MNPTPLISIIVCTHRPHRGRLERTLRGLAAQRLPADTWECVLVDNASGGDFPTGEQLRQLLPGLRVVQETQLGLSHARRRGCLESRGALLVFADDDNVLQEDYLEQVLGLFARYPTLGCIGGKSLPEFEVPPAAWTREFHALLALRDLGPAPLITPARKPGPLSDYPGHSPIGAGMALRREALGDWLRRADAESLPDRRGDSLSSGGDNDLVAHVLEAGWGLAYFPELVLTHLIPASRLEPDYLARLNRGIQKSWMQVLRLHRINPWKELHPWSLPLRKTRAWLRRRAWEGAAARIRFAGDCGHFEGRLPDGPQGLRTLLRGLGLGRLSYQLFHRPLEQVRSSLKDGGPLGRRRTRLGHEAMRRALETLPLPPGKQDSAASLEPHLLTGCGFWDQSLLCLWTLARQSGRHLKPHLYDDGSLGRQEAERLLRHFPDARIHWQKDTLERLDEHLPAHRFPHLRERWLNYPNLRKLTDVHAGRDGWKLVLDSDLLFFRRPELLMTWMDAPRRPLHAVDCKESYGYSRALMEALAGRPIPRLVNVGLCGLNGAELDWEKLEHWTATLIQREKTSYYLEQALVAMLLAGRDCDVAPAEDYRTFPSLREATEGSGVMQHYVDRSRAWYYRTSWRLALERGPGSDPAQR